MPPHCPPTAPLRAALAAALLLAGGLGLAGCGPDMSSTSAYPESRGGRVVEDRRQENASVFGPGGMQLFGDKKPDEEGGTGIGVNSFLWRATLDTLSFMPLVSADPFGGVVITDWFSPAEQPDERFKAQVYILGRTLRSDGIKVAVFRQVQDGGGWRDAEVSPQTATEMEDAILTRARQLRIDTAGQ